jgi:hypothetical protein
VIVVVTVNVLSQKYLETVRRTALRKRVWYRVLDRVERGIVNLTIGIIEKVQSPVLAQELVKILAKLRDAGKCAFTRHVEVFGYKKLRLIVDQVRSFGSEVSWLMDMGFAEWLAFTDYYSPFGSR